MSTIRRTVKRVGHKLLWHYWGVLGRERPNINNDGNYGSCQTRTDDISVMIEIT